MADDQQASRREFLRGRAAWRVVLGRTQQAADAAASATGQARAAAATAAKPGMLLSARRRAMATEFEIDYRPAQVDESHSYVLQASIEVNGRLRFVTDQRYAVLTQGAPAHVDMLLRAVEGQ